MWQFCSVAKPISVNPPAARVEPRKSDESRLWRPSMFAGAQSKDEREDGKGSDDFGRIYRARRRIEEAPIGGSSAHHRTYRGSAFARRPVGERGVSCRE